MSYQVVIRDRKTGEVRTHVEETPWRGDEDPNLFWWTEGNFSCDCNREREFLQAGGEDAEHLWDHDRCNRGPNRFVVEYFITPTGERFEYPQGFSQ